MQQTIFRLGPQIVGLLLLLLSANSFAVPVPDLYSATVRVSDRSEEQRQLAFRNALASVLVKVSGNRQVTSNPDAFDVLEVAPDLIQQYRYTGENELWAGFDGAVLQRKMRDAGLPVWGQDRPAVLLWLAVDWGGGRRGIVSSAQDTELKKAIERVAASRGLPLILPLVDSADREQMSFSDLWGGFDDKINAASERYEPGAVLVGRASRGSGSRLFVRWELQIAGIVEQWEGGLSPGLHRAADRLADRFAASGSDSVSSTQIAISGIGSLADYARASAYLEKLTVVRSVQVGRLAGNTVIFDVALRGDANQLFRILELNNVVRAAEAPAEIAAIAGAAHYQLLP